MRSIYNGLRSLIDETALSILSAELKDTVDQRIIRHAFGPGAWRYRGILLLLASKLFGRTGGMPVEAAVGIELIHEGVLILDDLIDRNAFRRGRPCLHREFGGEKAISFALFLGSKGFEILSHLGDQHVADLAAQAILEVGTGDILYTTAGRSIDVDGYLELCSLKSGSLFGAAAGIGAMLGDGGKMLAKTLSRFGRALGIASQIVGERPLLESSVRAVEGKRCAANVDRYDFPSCIRPTSTARNPRSMLRLINQDPASLLKDARRYLRGVVRNDDAEALETFAYEVLQAKGVCGAVDLGSMRASPRR